MKRLIVPIAFGSFVACASLVGLDDSDTATTSGTSSGTASSSGTGEVTQEGVKIAPTDLTLPAFKCNTTASSTITLSNNNDEDKPYEATLSQSDVFTIVNPTGTIPKHDKVDLKVEAHGTKPATATAAQISIKTGSSITVVTAKVDIQGASLKITPENADFGFVRQDQVSSPLNAIFTNEGNLPVEINGFDGPAELSNFTLPATLVVEANKPAPTPITMTAQKAGPKISVDATPKLKDPSVLCGAPPPVLKLIGQRVSDDVIVSPASADFGSADCNDSNSDNSRQVIKVSNYSLQKGASITAVLQGNSHFKVSPPTASLAATTDPAKPTTQDITIDVKSSGDVPGKVAESLDVAVTVDSTVTHYTIALTMNVFGSVWEFSPNTLTEIPNNGSKSTSLRNTGNADSCIIVQSTDGAFTGPDYGPLPPFSESFKVSFAATAGSGAHTSTITLKQSFCFPLKSFPFCKPTPTLTVSGNAP